MKKCYIILPDFDDHPHSRWKSSIMLPETPIYVLNYFIRNNTLPEPENKNIWSSEEIILPAELTQNWTINENLMITKNDEKQIIDYLAATGWVTNDRTFIQAVVKYLDNKVDADELSHLI